MSLSLSSQASRHFRIPRRCRSRWSGDPKH